MSNQKYTVNEIINAVRQELAEANKTLKIADGITDDDYKYLGVIAAAEKRLPEPLPVATGVEEAAKEYVTKCEISSASVDPVKRTARYNAFLAGAVWQSSQSPVSDAVGFGRWLTVNGYDVCGVDKWQKLYSDAEDESEYTTAELYSIFNPQSTAVSKEQEELWDEAYQKIRPFINIEGAVKFKEISQEYLITKK